MRAATDDGEQLFVEESGNGDPVLLVQGLGYASWAWREQAPLAEHVRLIAFDNRGAGRSSKPETGYSMARMASDAVTVLEAIGGPPAHVMGVSMGGYIAQMLALQRPDLVRSLILVSTSAGGSSYYPIPETTREKWLAASDLPPAEYARATMRLSFAPGWAEAHAHEYEGWLEARLEHPTPAACWREQFAACEAFLSEGAPVERLAAPTLIVHGDADRVLPVANATDTASRIPGSRSVIMPGRGHLCFIEDPAAFNRHALDFISEVNT